MFFTAIALIAFSSTNIAKTIEEDKQKPTIKNQNEIKKEETVVSCEDVAAYGAEMAERLYHNQTGECLSTKNYNAIYNLYMALCLQ